MLIRHLLRMLKEFNLQVRISIVLSEMNRADITMSVKQKWLKIHDETVVRKQLLLFVD